MKEITIDGNTKGIIVYAKPKVESPRFNEWVVLIHHTVLITDEFSGKTYYEIHRHISYLIKKGVTYQTLKPTYAPFGYSCDYNFYVPTEEQKDIIRNVLVQNRWKFVRALNKIIRLRGDKFIKPYPYTIRPPRDNG